MVASPRQLISNRALARAYNSQVGELGAWLDCTEGGDLSKLSFMPDKAQRELSASVVSLAVHAFEERLAGATTPDASRRLVNWRSVCDKRAGRWVAAVPWDRHGHYNVNNTAYYVSFARRYRLERPRRLRLNSTNLANKLDRLGYSR